MNSLKNVFRKTVERMPLSVHKVITQKKIDQILEHIMPADELIKCESDLDYRTVAVKKQIKNYPKQNAALNKLINDLFNNNPNYMYIEEKLKKKIIKDIKFCWFGYGFQVDEYVFFDLGGCNKKTENRRMMVSDAERLAFRFAANDFTQTVYADKASAYGVLKPYYKRDVVLIDGKKDKEEFMQFVRNKDRFVQKIVDSSRGQGVTLIDLNTIPGGKEAYFESVAGKGRILLEDVIIQSPEMSKFNPDSVNTVRLSTFYTKDGIECPFGFFRTGRKGSFIDNCATGGVFSTIDTTKGVVCSDSCDEFGNRYEVHPDSGLALKGFKIPEWEQAVAICKNVAMLTPSLKYLSWDLAYSDNNGWEIVEVNTSGQFMQQAGTLKGIRTEFKSIVDNMDLLVPFTIRSE